MFLFVYMCNKNHREIYKKMQIHKLEIIFKNQNSCEKSFDSNVDS